MKKAIDMSNFVLAFNILCDSKDFLVGNKLSNRSYSYLNSLFERNLKKKLDSLGFIDISGKIVYTAFWAMRTSCNLVLKGPPGVGKSLFSKKILPELWVENSVKPYVITIQPDRNMEISTLVADRGIKKGDTIIEEGQIADAIKFANNGRRVILVLEEVNQWPPKVLKDLNDFLEERKLERKIARTFINLSCDKKNLFVIANYNPDGITLAEDDTGSVSSRFIFCDLPFPKKTDLEKIIKVNIIDKEYVKTSIGYEIKKEPYKFFLRSLSDICYSIKSSIDQGELGPLAMPISTRNIINFGKALMNNTSITDATIKFLIDPILEKYVRDGPLTNVDSKSYNEYIRTIFKALKQILGTINPVNESNLNQLKKGLNISINELFKLKKKKAYNVKIRSIKYDLANYCQDKSNTITAKNPSNNNSISDNSIKKSQNKLAITPPLIKSLYLNCPICNSDFNLLINQFNHQYFIQYKNKTIHAENYDISIENEFFN
ncbi:MAG: AAA family ATPase [Candidatus Helarchaeota archaeon]